MYIVQAFQSFIGIQLERGREMMDGWNARGIKEPLIYVYLTKSKLAYHVKTFLMHGSHLPDKVINWKKSCYGG